MICHRSDEPGRVQFGIENIGDESMDNFALLGSVAVRLHGEFRTLYYMLLPLFFALAVAITWFRGPNGGPDFVQVLKRAFIATLLLVGFTEMTDTILWISKGLSEKISDMSGLDAIIGMAGDKAKSYTLSTTSILIGFNDLIIAVLSFLSYLILYAARFITVAMYHFSWVFLTLLAPFLLLFHVFSSTLTVSLFRSMIEIASWRVVWSVLSAMLTALPFGNAYQAEGGYITVVIINFIIALAMLGTPFVVHSLVGSGFSSIAGTISSGAAAAIVAVPIKAQSVATIGRSAISDVRTVAARPITMINAFKINRSLKKESSK